MNENEIWLPIEGYEDYQVSNLGRIKSLRDNKGNYREKILKQVKFKNGYLYVSLYKEGKIKTCRVHRLVATAFLDNPNNLKCVNHKDENKENNCVDNLEWCDNKYNSNYGTVQQRRVASTDYKARTANTDYKARTANTDYKAIAEKQSKRVYQYSLDGTLVAIWQSTMECGRNGYSFGAVASCCRGEAKSHKGYMWSYEELKKQD